MRIKICGITNVADALEASRLGADALGLNFYARSPRAIDQATAAAILDELPPFVEPVGVFVNEPLRQIEQTLAGLERIRTIQWHGDMHPLDEPCRFRLLPAFRIRDRNDLTAVTHYVAQCRPAGVLLDAHVEGEYGGTGQCAPWELLTDFQPGVPVILAGGLTPENVAEAVRLVRPFAVDVASGVELSPGRKDLEKLRRFIDNARAAWPCEP